MKSCIRRMKPGAEVVLSVPEWTEGRTLSRWKYTGKRRFVLDPEDRYEFDLLDDNDLRLVLPRSKLQEVLFRVAASREVNFRIDPGGSRVTVRVPVLKRLWTFIGR